MEKKKYIGRVVCFPYPLEVELREIEFPEIDDRTSETTKA